MEKINIIKKLAITAGQKIMEIYENESLFLSVEYKTDHSPLTLADKASNKLIVEGLKKHFLIMQFSLRKKRMIKKD